MATSANSKMNELGLTDRQIAIAAALHIATKADGSTDWDLVMTLADFKTKKTATNTIGTMNKTIKAIREHQGSTNNTVKTARATATPKKRKTVANNADSSDDGTPSKKTRANDDSDDDYGPRVKVEEREEQNRIPDDFE